MLLFLQNSMLVVNFNRILMGESWGDPQEFRPDRFIDESGKIVMPEDYLPFSFGNKKKNQISITPFVEIQRNLFLFHIIRFSSRIVQYCILLSQASIAVWAKCWPRATSSWSLRRCCSTSRSRRCRARSRRATSTLTASPPVPSPTASSWQGERSACAYLCVFFMFVV